MGACINTSPITIIHSMESFKKKTQGNLAQKKSEDLAENDFTLSEEEDDNISLSSEQSQISIKARMEENELIFL